MLAWILPTPAAPVELQRDVVQLVVVRLDERRYAFPLKVVQRVIRAVDITPLPNAPAIVLGAIDVQGRVLPVLSLRRRLGLPDREIMLADWFVLATTAQRTVALVVNESEGVVELPRAAIVASRDVSPGLLQFPGIVTIDGDVVLIDELDAFLSLEDARRVDDAISASTREL